MVTKCFPAEQGGYSLASLCHHVGVKVEHAEKILDIKLVDPYGEHYTSAYTDESSASTGLPQRQNSNPIVKKKQKRARPTAPTSKKQKPLIRGEKQKSEFLPGASDPVLKNRQSQTFWKERPAGDGFPEGWIVHVHRRQNGATGGRHLDLYWFTKTGKKLRSSIEIARFLSALEIANGDEERAHALFKGRL
jgi:hypothetical protein